MKRPKQLHVWLADADYAFLLDFAEREGETMSTTVRRLIRLFRFGRFSGAFMRRGRAGDSKEAVTS